MDAGLLWTAGGTLVGCFALIMGAWQLRLQVRGEKWRQTSRQRGRQAEFNAASVPVVPPLGSLPTEVRGRRDDLQDLVEMARQPTGQVVILAGMGGVDNRRSPLAERVQNGIRRHVWWVSAAEAGSLVGGMLEIARILGAPVAELEAIASASPQAPGILWARLDREKHRWLLIIDNADAPQAFAIPGVMAGPRSTADETGWLRVPRSGMVVVTTRLADPSAWGRHFHLRRIGRLSAEDSGQILRDLASESGNEAEAQRLGERLGGLPLALHLAGRYLGSDFTLTRTFAAYRKALDESPQVVSLLAPDPDMASDARSTIMHTWEISLDALNRYGAPQARTILRLISCFAAATPIPADMLDATLLARLIGPTPMTPVGQVAWLEQGLRGLIRLGLVDSHTTATSDNSRLLVLHPVVADTSRAYLEMNGNQGDPPPNLIRHTELFRVGSCNALW